MKIEFCLSAVVIFHGLNVTIYYKGWGQSWPLEESRHPVQTSIWVTCWGLEAWRNNRVLEGKNSHSVLEYSFLYLRAEEIVSCLLASLWCTMLQIILCSWFSVRRFFTELLNDLERRRESVHLIAAPSHYLMPSVLTKDFSLFHHCENL